MADNTNDTQCATCQESHDEDSQCPVAIGEREPAVPAFPQRYRVSAYGGVVASDSGRYLHVEDVLQYLRELNVEAPRG